MNKTMVQKTSVKNVWVRKTLIQIAMVGKTLVHKRINIDLDYDVVLTNDEGKTLYSPEKGKVIRWIRAVLQKIENQGDIQLTVRVVTEKEMIELNGTYRHKWVSTNVLAFPFEALSGVTSILIGDVVICAEVVQQQAIVQQKTPDQHWMHMVVHGTLHLLGFDHESEDGTMKMESIEKTVISKFGYPDPYAEYGEEGNV